MTDGDTGGLAEISISRASVGTMSTLYDMIGDCAGSMTGEGVLQGSSTGVGMSGWSGRSGSGSGYFIYLRS